MGEVTRRARMAELLASLGKLADQFEERSFLLVYDPAHDLVVPVHTFEDTRMLEVVLEAFLDRLRTGQHQRERVAVGGEEEVGS